jgi:hypothetical protein
LSVAIIAVYGSFSLLQALLLTAGAGAALAGFSGMPFKSKAGDLAALKQKMLNDVASELGRVEEYGENLAHGKLRGELDAFRTTLGERLDRGDAESVVAELHDLQRRIREEEVDEEQCLARAEDVSKKIAELRGKEIAPWEKVLVRLESEAERPAGASASEHLLRLQCVRDELAEMERLLPVASGADIDALRETPYAPAAPSGPQPGGGPEDDARACIHEIRDEADRIARLDAWEGERLRPVLNGLKADTPFPGRLFLLRRQLRATSARLRERAALTTLFREKLAVLDNLLQAAQASGRDFTETAATLARRCETLAGGKYVDRAAFMALYEDVCRFVFARNEEIADALLAQKVGDVLDELGYELLTDAEPVPLAPDRVQYLESPYEGYRVMVKVGGRGEVSVRLVRVVADEKERTAEGEYQRQKDVEAGRKWCRDCDGFLDKMREQGIPLDVSVRREPEESEVLVVVDRAQEPRRKRARPAPAAKMRDMGLNG